MKIELTIKSTYLPEWGLWEGIRELIQNAKDAETEFCAPMEVDWYNDTLRIENSGCTMPHQALLFGHTTKYGRDDLIGKFGEGLKLGVLALVRAGHAVKIRSGDEVWVPEIGHSEKFDTEVLFFDIVGGRQDKNRVRVEVGGISKDVWNDLRSRFLFFNKALPKSNSCYGRVLYEPEYRGAVYVKGIFVERKDDFRFGYDLHNVSVDRDRHMVNSWELKYYTKALLDFEARKDAKTMDLLYSMLLENAPDVEGFVDHSVNEELAMELALRFERDFGKEAFPVVSPEEGMKMGHLGRRTIQVSRALQSAVSPIMGTYKDVLQQLCNGVTDTFLTAALTADEKNNLDRALSFLSLAGGLHGLALEIVKFNDPNLEGTYDGTAARIRVARPILASPWETLRVLVHEVAHVLGSDGEKNHIAAIEGLWKKILSSAMVR